MCNWKPSETKQTTSSKKLVDKECILHKRICRNASWWNCLQPKYFWINWSVSLLFFLKKLYFMFKGRLKKRHSDFPYLSTEGLWSSRCTSWVEHLWEWMGSSSSPGIQTAVGFSLDGLCSLYNTQTQLSTSCR